MNLYTQFNIDLNIRKYIREYTRKYIRKYLRHLYCHKIVWITGLFCLGLVVQDCYLMDLGFRRNLYFFTATGCLFFVFLSIRSLNSKVYSICSVSKINWISGLFVVYFCFIPFSVGVGYGIYRNYQYDSRLLTDGEFYGGLTIDSEPKLSRKYWRFVGVHDNSRFRVLIGEDAIGFTPKYGDEVSVLGTYTQPSLPRNPGEWNNLRSSQSKQVMGTIRSHDCRFVASHSQNPVVSLSYWLRHRIRLVHSALLDYPYDAFLTSIIFGTSATDLPIEFYEAFQLTGLTHLLVVSGSQVTLLSGIILFLCRQAQLNRRFSFLIILFILTLFILITGGGSAIIRASLMSVIVLFLKLWQRNPHPIHILSLTALIMLVYNPFYLFDIGAQLSFLATFSLLFSIPELSATLSPARTTAIHSLLRLPVTLIGSLYSCCIFLINGFLVCFSPFIWTTPLLWSHFSSISLISLLANFVVFFWIELLVTIGFAGSCLGLIFTPLALFFDYTCFLLLILLKVIVFYLASLPWATFYITPPHLTVIFVLYLFIYVLFSRYGSSVINVRTRFRPELGLVCLYVIFLVWKWLPHSQLTVYVFDVGQGDAILISTPNRRHILIDTGPILRDFKALKANSSSIKQQMPTTFLAKLHDLFNPTHSYSKQNTVYYDAGKQTLLPAFRKLGVNKLDMVIVTHFDNDHVGGLQSILDNIPVGLLIDHGCIIAYPKWYKKYLESHTSHLPLSRTQRADYSIQLDTQSILRLFLPAPIESLSTRSKNDRSVVVQLVHGDHEFLFTGDLSSSGESYLIDQYGPLLFHSDVLKLGHHGSKTSSSLDFINSVQPNYGVVSAGRQNKYNHPSPSVIERLQKHNIPILSTKESGCIIFKSDGKQLSVQPFYLSN